MAVRGLTDIKSLKDSLDTLYLTYDFRSRIKHDPISIPKRYRRRLDVEAAAFIASTFAFGRVNLFMPVVENILHVMGKSPYDFIRRFDARIEGRLFSNIRYRFCTSKDIVGVIHVMSVLFNRYGSIEGAFMKYFDDRHGDVGTALAGAVEEIMDIDTSPAYGNRIKPRGFRFSFPSPRRGSACKRANLFLRWMVRRNDIDLGLWRGVSPGKLVIPLDTHIGRVSRCLGLTKRKSDDWKTAVEITAALKTLDPEDPLKYDFALCHRGISGVCDIEDCDNCRLRLHGAAG